MPQESAGEGRISLSELSMDNFPENPKNRTCPLTQNGAYETKMWLPRGDGRQIRSPWVHLPERARYAAESGRVRRR